MEAVEPYAGVGFGIYHFFSETTLENEDGVEVASKTLKSDTNFGWNFTGGIKLYFEL